MLILLRHGRTTANAKGLLQGRVDNPLDELGRSQAVAAAAAIGPVDRVIASPLVRARQTAEALGADTQIDDRFIELNYGDWEERPVNDVGADVWAKWRNDLDFRPPGGESLRELGVRVRAALDELRREHADETVVVVSHVSPMKASTAWALGVDDRATWRMYVAQAAICRVELSGGAPRLVEFNSTWHLDGSDVSG